MHSVQKVCEFTLLGLQFNQVLLSLAPEARLAKTQAHMQTHSLRKSRYWKTCGVIDPLQPSRYSTSGRRKGSSDSDHKSQKYARISYHEVKPNRSESCRPAAINHYRASSALRLPKPRQWQPGWNHLAPADRLQRQAHRGSRSQNEEEQAASQAANSRD
jgi:hypothetical protein